MRKTFTFNLALSCLVSGCTAAPQTPVPTITAEDALAASSRVVDCEWKAVERYDDGHYAVSALARRIMGICADEISKARLASNLSPSDPEIEKEEFKQAAEIVDQTRKKRVGGK